MRGAPQGVSAAQPTAWEACADPATGVTYWYNRATGQSTWQNPHTESV